MGVYSVLTTGSGVEFRLFDKIKIWSEYAA